MGVLIAMSAKNDLNAMFKSPILFSSISRTVHLANSPTFEQISIVAIRCLMIRYSAGNHPFLDDLPLAQAAIGLNCVYCLDTSGLVKYRPVLDILLNGEV